MNNENNSKHIAARGSIAFLVGVIGVAVVGYFVGINDGVPQEDFEQHAPWLSSQVTGSDPPTEPPTTSTIAAVTYAEMRRSETGPTSQWKPKLAQIPQPQYDLFAEIKPSEDDKLQSTLTRASRRAFNGAPPIIPHVVEGTNDAACYACHGEGKRIENRVANRMSHGFLANCVQCHAPPPPKPFTDVDAEVQTSFVGLPAPLNGERAFPGAPPTIPHSTWMRDQCLACHGGNTGWAGLESTHPWRSNCLQCHAPSATLDQSIVPDKIGFLPEPNVK
ncbi:Nitrate reductase cytochrome c-type subunit (NapB) [Novipirellula galeiformis]|uniref:Nitrate reductase cytochrome c-type subunit (NapB) n=1 Tax=Novipirellula galeiformis TaxID=2528004 RepID=A0A5C6CL80_9BACT|nr:diheme cytochrome c precursor [Novipirellula galeiformis]TWU24071.1 Nitrate reductase cytochrome c-type subunit (NapB) [Novipirellula galeiformis]